MSSNGAPFPPPSASPRDSTAAATTTSSIGVPGPTSGLSADATILDQYPNLLPTAFNGQMAQTHEQALEQQTSLRDQTAATTVNFNNDIPYPLPAVSGGVSKSYHRPVLPSTRSTHQVAQTHQQALGPNNIVLFPPSGASHDTNLQYQPNPQTSFNGQVAQINRQALEQQALSMAYTELSKIPAASQAEARAFIDGRLSDEERQYYQSTRQDPLLLKHYQMQYAKLQEHAWRAHWARWEQQNVHQTRLQIPYHPLPGASHSQHHPLPHNAQRPAQFPTRSTSQYPMPGVAPAPGPYPEPTTQTQPARIYRSIAPRPSPCQHCTSTLHETAACAYVILHNDELLARQILTTGSIVDFAHRANRICTFHRDLTASIVDPALRGEEPPGQVPFYPELLDLTLLEKTALLPICDGCQAANIVQADITFDTCVCATGIVLGSCTLCEIGRLTAARKLAIAKRCVTDAQGQPVLAIGSPYIALNCACGTPVNSAVEKARRCVGCGGVATAPYQDMHGHLLHFIPSTVEVQDARYLAGHRRLGDQGLADLTAPDMWQMDGAAGPTVAQPSSQSGRTAEWLLQQPYLPQSLGQVPESTGVGGAAEAAAERESSMGLTERSSDISLTSLSRSESSSPVSRSGSEVFEETLRQLDGAAAAQSASDPGPPTEEDVQPMAVRTDAAAEVPELPSTVTGYGGESGFTDDDQSFAGYFDFAGWEG